MSARSFTTPTCVASVLILAGIAIASTGTAMVIASQEIAPARLTQTTHGLSSLLTAAELENSSEKQIVSYRIGWAYVRRNRTEFHTGNLMSVPVGIAPGSLYSVPDQAVPIDRGADQVIFFVAEVTFVDGGHWKAAKKDIERIGRTTAAP